MVNGRAELLACSYCGGRFESTELAPHKQAKHGIFEENCRRKGGHHGPLVVVVDQGRVHILARGGTTLAPIVPEEGWPGTEAPAEVRHVIEKENGSLIVRDGGFLPRSRASLDALERIYHELAQGTTPPGPEERPRREGVLARYIRERWKESVRLPGSVGEIKPSGVGPDAPPVDAPPHSAQEQVAAKRCRACDAVLTGPECQICGLRSE